MQEIEVLQSQPAGLPWPPTWRITREFVLSQDVAALAAALGALAEDEPHYWILHQGPASPGSLRQALVNLDTDAALAAGLSQMMQRDEAPEHATFQCLPAQVAAGVLFTRHPLRPDLDHAVVEGLGPGSAEKERLILHPDGQLAFHSGEDNWLASEVGAEAFSHLLAAMQEAYTGPRAGEWVWDGNRLWLVQALPVGSLPEPKEAWTRRAGQGFTVQAISPLWYTLMARWLKTEFWQPLGKRMGWQQLAKVEPYRRIHSHLYSNAQFFRALQESLDSWHLPATVPPAWRPREAQGNVSRQPGPVRQGLMTWQLRQLGKAVERQATRNRLVAADEPEQLWLAVMGLDKLGEKLARIEGQLAYLYTDTPADAPLADREVAALLVQLEGLASDEGQRWLSTSALAAGADPVWSRFSEQGSDVRLLTEKSDAIPRERLQRVAAAARRAPQGLVRSRAEAAALRRRIGGELRALLRQMAAQLVQAGFLAHPDDIFFLYFDELWQCWHGQARAGLRELIGQRKVRYLSDAHAGPADWIMDQVGYGASALGQARNRDLVRGYALVPGRQEGRVQRLLSGWQLNQIEPGDILVVDRCEAAWLPWMLLAGGLIISHRDPSDPAVWLARAAGLPAVWGVIDATHSLVDGSQVRLDADQGQIYVDSPVDED